MGDYWKALSYLFSCGGWGILFLIDLFAMRWIIKGVKTKEKSEKKSLLIAYMCWLPFGGLLGLHHFYLRRFTYLVDRINSLDIGMEWSIVCLLASLELGGSSTSSE